VGDDAGLFFTPGDAEALAAQILGLLGDSTRRANMASAARNRALGFDDRVVAEQLARVYQQVRALN
jgi:glycosyltransferase involved in cell wall biosynthesis